MASLKFKLLKAGLSKAPFGIALTVATKALNDPRVREQLAAAPAKATAAIQLWREGRAGTDHRTMRERANDLTARFGQKGLEQRSQRLRKVTGELSPLQSSGQLPTGSVDAMSRTLDGVDLQLRVAGALSGVKRKRAQFTIGGVLDDLEKALWDATSGPETAGA
jgi:hypothetical protein